MSSKNDHKVSVTFTIVNAAETGSLTPRTVQTNELSEPAGMIPMGIEIPSFWLPLLSRPFRTCTITTVLLNGEDFK